jgi:hypothetical protein
MVGNYAGGEEAAALCDGTASTLRAGCYLALGSVLGNVSSTTAEREADCKALTVVRSHVSACIEGTRASRPSNQRL